MDLAGTVGREYQGSGGTLEGGESGRQTRSGGTDERGGSRSEVVVLSETSRSRVLSTGVATPTSLSVPSAEHEVRGVLPDVPLTTVQRKAPRLQD